ncbi:ATP-binding protein [Caminicella sporogenes]|nr:ATP-binding protein [Caminicella sporogenes]RKD22257.1 histidine kinase [Caminicella sporogenes]WIF95886.1 ATP-binding protein [Caminicella sporogenes]
MKESISLSLPSKPEYVSIARLTSSAIANSMGFNIEDIEDIRLAVGEACNNAVLHGRNGDSNFNINFTIYEDKFVIEIFDEGKGFEIEKCPEPDFSNPKESGLGLFIIESLMDEVEVISSPGEGTNVKMIKYLND